MILRDFPKNMAEFIEMFGTEEQCQEYLVRQKWGGEGFKCPRCSCTTCWITKRNLFVCTECEYNASLTAGTAMEGTRKPLKLWFLAMYLMVTSKQGVSAKEIQRQLGLSSYQTAWAWLHKLRDCMVNPDREPLKGKVEVDETYVGGIAPQSAGGRSTIKKTAVVCAVEDQGTRCGRVRLAVIANCTKAKLKEFLDGKLEPETTVATDGWRGYDGIDNSGYAHIRYVMDDDPAHVLLPKVHRVFSLMKRWLLATHQGAVSRKHLQSYLHEYEFRFNRRTSHAPTHLFQRLSEGAVRGKCRPYWKIVGRTKNGVSVRIGFDLAGVASAPAVF
jgi:transposase-like protein